MINKNSLANLKLQKRKKENYGYQYRLPIEKINLLIDCLLKDFSIKAACKKIDICYSTAKKYYNIGDPYRGIPAIKEVIQRKRFNHIDSIAYDLIKLADVRLFYIINNTQYYKIGITDDIERRKKNLQSANPTALTIVFQKKIFKSLIFESRIKQYFKGKKVSGEWFYFDNVDIEYIKSEALKLEVI